MAEIKIAQAYKVTIMESERGWGQKVDEIKYFDNEREAKNFVEEFNKYNDKPYVPDWYMYATYDGKVK